MFLIVGLGNPGKEYENTRHNVGFMFADLLSRRYEFHHSKARFKSEISEGMIGGKKVLLQKPLTYMNLSGNAVLQAADFFKVPIENIIVIHDDLDLALGKIRVKTGGGAGGHNGLKDIDARLGKEYMRIRIGIGHPGDRDAVSAYVLSRFSPDDRQIIDEIADNATRSIDLLLEGDSNRFTTKAARVPPLSAVKLPPAQQPLQQPH